MSRNDDNFDFIKQQFENENINAPDTLGEAQLLSKILNDNDEEKIIKVDNSAAIKKRRIRSGIAIAAAFAIVLSAGMAYPYLREKYPEPVENIGEVENDGVGLAHFTSHTEINSLINRMHARDKVFEFGIAKSADAYATAETNGEGGGGGADDYGTTYKQVDAVDEADIIKTDGTYIYHYNRGAIQIYAANNGNPSFVRALENSAFSYDDYSEDETNENSYSYSYSCLQEFYLKDGRLIAISLENNGDYYSSNDCTVVQVFDISDINDIQVVDEYRQSGFYNSSRMVGDTVYLVTNHYVTPGNKDYYIPYCGVGEGQETLDADCVYKTASPSESSYLVIGAVDTENGVHNTDTKAIFGASSTIYCNEDNMFITNAVGSYTFYAGYNPDYEDKIQIIKAKLSEDSIEFTAAGFVEGTVNDQFSMDEKDGCLRIATTTYKWGTDEVTVQTNNLFVLDENLKIIGSVKGFANDESIRAVRFVGNKAYVITYEYVDPLFIIDLSDNTNPKIEGSVEIDGFSSLLAPIDENRLLGIGYSTYEGEFGMVTDGLKIVLFDISDPKNPKVLDFAEFYDTSSEAQYNHKALVQNSTLGYFAMPYTRTEQVELEDGYYDYVDLGCGVLTVQPDGDTLNFRNDFTADDQENEYECAPRCTYIGNYIYLIDRAGEIHAYDFTAETEAVG